MKTAESDVIAVETLVLGEPWAAPHAAAIAAIDADRTDAEAVLFPFDLAPMSADVIAEYVFHTNRLGAANYGPQLAAIHARSVVGHRELARALRSVSALEDVGTAAIRSAAPTDELEPIAVAADRAAAQARGEYMAMVSRQIIAVEGHELAPAASKLVACEGLLRRLAVAKARHEEQARIDLARIETERRAVARAVIDRTVERVRAAQAVAEDARLKALMSAEEYRKIKAAALVERLRLSGGKYLRIGAERALFAVDDLASTAPEMSIEQLNLYEAALRAHEADR